ncbi:DUF5348 domain-containing protein [Peribacillus butanolivorans]|uniref:DUF5348 domain-containing protein n=1 Tax=Peribacillus butanolivorans TaxID=421767 RepID=UPI0036778D22
MKLEHAYELLDELQKTIKKFEDRYGNLPDEFDLNNYDDVEVKFKQGIACSIMDKLSDVSNLLEWVNKPIVVQGQLIKNFSGRYEIEDTELSSGYPLDFYDQEDEQWYKSRVEHNGSDYYIVGLGREKNINGVLVRIR